MTVRNKYKGLIYLMGLVIVLPLSVYRIAIDENIRMSIQTIKYEKEVAVLKAKTGMEDVGRTPLVHSSEVLQSGILVPEIIDSEAGTRCRVVKYTPYIVENRDGMTVYTAELVISGSYTDLLRLMAKMENNKQGCLLVSASLRSISQRQKKEKELHMTLILQQITQNI